MAEYFRFISNSGQIDIRLQIHEKKKKKQKPDKPTDLFWYSIVFYRNSGSFRLGKKNPAADLVEDQSSDIIPPFFSQRAEGGGSSPGVSPSVIRQSSDRKWFLFLACAFQPHFSWPNRTTYVSVMPGRKLRYVSRYLVRSLIGLTVAYVSGSHSRSLRASTACAVQSNRCRHWQGERSEVCAGSFALLLCRCSVHGWFKVRNIITRVDGPGSSHPWNPTEARVSYATQGMAAVWRNLLTMPLAICAYVYVHVHMYIISSLGNPPAAPTYQPFSCWLRRS